LFIVTSGTWAFIALLDEVHESALQNLDETLLQWLAAHQGPPWVQEAMRDVTALGGMAVLTFITIVVVGFLSLQRKKHAAGLLIVAVGGGLMLSMILKWAIARPRPLIVPHGAYIYSSSFPSGHSMLSAVVYLTLGTLLARITPQIILRVYLIAIAILLTAGVGFSRVYLGVHWPSDVLAGWSAGLAWASTCWLVATWLQRRGVVEISLTEPDDAPAS